MEKIKEWFQNTMGVFGMILFWFLYVLLTFAPLSMILRLPWWADTLIIAAVIILPYVGSIVELGMWAWSMVLAVQMEFQPIYLVYYLCAAIYVLGKLLPMALSIITAGIIDISIYLDRKRQERLDRKVEKEQQAPRAKRKSFLAAYSVFLSVAIVCGAIAIPRYIGEQNDLAYQAGYDEGQEDGEKSGYDEGYASGLDQGKKYAVNNYIKNTSPQGIEDPYATTEELKRYASLRDMGYWSDEAYELVRSEIDGDFIPDLAGTAYAYYRRLRDSGYEHRKAYAIAYYAAAGTTEIHNTDYKPVVVINVTSDVERGEEASLELCTTAGHEIGVSIYYQDKHIMGLEKKISDEMGLVDWKWSFKNNLTPGKYRLEIWCRYNHTSVFMNVT